MPSESRSAYWREVLRKASPDTVGEWARAGGSSVVSLFLLLYALGRDRAMEELVLSVSLGLASGVVLLVFWGWNIYAAVYEAHAENLANISKIERERDALLQQVSDKRKSQSIADALTKHLESGLAVANTPIADSVDFKSWKDASKVWRFGLSEEMRRIGCTNQEIAAIFGVQPMDFERAPKASQYADPVWNHHKTVHAIQVERLRDVIDGYTDRPILSRTRQ